MDLKGRIDSTTDAVRQRVAMFTHIISMSYEDFKRTIADANIIGSQIPGDHLIFSIIPKSDASIFWKTTVRVQCARMKEVGEAEELVSTRVLKLRQYLGVFNELTHMSLIQAPITASEVLDKLGMSMSRHNSISAGSNDREECCICMERISDVILSCAHAYCQRCINQWLSRYSRRLTSELTCPVCRAQVQGEGDAWVLAEAPDPEESQAEMQQVLMELAERSGKPG